MDRLALIAALAGALLAFPAYAQDSDPTLDGAPPPLQIPKPTAPRPTPPAPKPVAPKPIVVAPRATAPAPVVTTSTAEQARLARQAETQRAEQIRLDTLANELQSQKTRLDIRATELAAEEKRLARERTDQDADYARKLAELDRQSTAPAIASATAPAPFSQPAPVRIRISYDDARRACTRAGMSEAVDNDFFSARYEAAPRFFERQRELRGRMRMDDRDGYLTVDTICQLDANGAVLRFDVAR